jgi:hypothetical protein
MTAHVPPRMDAGDEGPDPRGNLGRGNDDPSGGVDLQPYFEACRFPARKGDLIDGAARVGAPEHVRDLFRRLPDREYRDVLDLSRAVGGWREAF